MTHSVAALAERFSRVRSVTEALARPLSAEDAGAQSMTDASPTKWHWAHTSWFFESFVLSRDPVYQPLHTSYAFLFNSYYETLGARHPRPARGILTRPSLTEVMTYRTHVTEHVLELLDRQGDDLGELGTLVELGLQHEQQHQELIVTDLKHLFASNPLFPAYHERPRGLAHGALPLAWCSFAEGVREIGHDGTGFAFDNELPRHRAFIEPYQLATRLVTNGEFLAFMQDGGYARPELWLSDGLRVVTERGWSAPAYWHRAATNAHEVYTLSGIAEVVLDEPVCHVSYYEADAYARWAGYRLPNEAEWEAAAALQRIRGNFLDSGRLQPCVAQASDEPLLQLFGDTWEWTASAYSPYPGYRAPTGPIGEYNGKFMCNQMVLRGGSCATPADHVRASYRNFFPADARWQFTGIRLARSA